MIELYFTALYSSMPHDVASNCMVCTTPITSAHLGMNICSACASFFKRSKTAGRQYNCRQNNGKCTIATGFTDGKFVCRRCRFEKCVAIGMEYDGPMRERRKAPLSILQRIKTELKASVKRRREQESEVINFHGGHKRYQHPTMEIYDINQETCFEIYRISLVESYEFFKNVFPAFSELSQREQDLIFKDYAGKLCMLEGFHRSRQIWGRSRRFTMCSILTCYDLDREISQEDIEKCDNANELLSSAKTNAEEQSAVFLPIYTRCGITDNEYYALVALVMSEVDSTCELSEAALTLLDRYRQEVLKDLQDHYRNELGLQDYASRLGNVMSLNHAIQECKSLFKLFFSFFATLFDVFITDNLIKHFLL